MTDGRKSTSSVVQSESIRQFVHQIRGKVAARHALETTDLGPLSSATPPIGVLAKALVRSSHVEGPKTITQTGSSQHVGSVRERDDGKARTRRSCWECQVALTRMNRAKAVQSFSG